MNKQVIHKLHRMLVLEIQHYDWLCCNKVMRLQKRKCRKRIESLLEELYIVKSGVIADQELDRV